MNPNIVLGKMPEAVAIRYVENRRNERTAIAQYTATPDLLTCWTSSVRTSWHAEQPRIRQDPGGSDTAVGARPAGRAVVKGTGRYARGSSGVNSVPPPAPGPA